MIYSLNNILTPLNQGFTKDNAKELKFSNKKITLRFKYWSQVWNKPEKLDYKKINKNRENYSAEVMPDFR